MAQKENIEKKEKFLETLPKPSKKKEGMPTYLIGLLVILAILIGIATGVVFFKPSNGDDQNGTIPIGNNDQNYRTIEVLMVYSNECKQCLQTTTIEDLFRVRQIPYTLTKLEASSPQGASAIKKYQITMLPAAIVDAGKIAFFPATKTDFDNEIINGSFTKVGGSYVIPEQNWNENYHYPLYLLEQPREYCTSNKPSVVQFDDYYTPVNTSSRRALYSFLEDFNEDIDYHYSFLQSVSIDSNAVLANLFLTCAGDQGKFAQLERTITGIYCNNPFKGDPTILTDVEIDGCTTISEHYGFSLKQTELDVALGRAKLDNNEFISCINNKQNVYNTAEQIAKQLNIQRTGTFLVDCRETAALTQVKTTLCRYHPDLAGCSAQDANSTQ